MPTSGSGLLYSVYALEGSMRHQDPQIPTPTAGDFVNQRVKAPIDFGLTPMASNNFTADEL